MAERLTEVGMFIDTPVYKIKNGKKGEAVDKLAKLEDILEKYGVESVEELDKKIAYYIDKIDLEAENEYLKKVIEKQNMISKIISKNRDTWQKACELACDVILRFTDGCPCKADYFYQQAKKEGEQK